MTDEIKTRLWNALIGLIVAVTTAITIVATSWQTQRRVKNSENLIQETVETNTAAQTAVLRPDLDAADAKEAVEEAAAEIE